AYVERLPALLQGYYRAACILSTIYRGTPAAPGLVLGLDRGGACRGLAYAVAAESAGDVIDYLYQREMITSVYRPRYVNVALNDGRRVRALTFITNREHVQYAGRLSLEEAACLVRQGHGRSGSSRDYLFSTVEHLKLLGIRDTRLHKLLALVNRDQAF
ncbi:MAG: gamma-glutamylcyclotransferase, partial [Alphaproteobacteria bacterium]|nr:gamma-glutamylcyclotransferase [Alphaproteobacteria bacterium]